MPHHAMADAPDRPRHLFTCAVWSSTSPQSTTGASSTTASTRDPPATTATTTCSDDRAAHRPAHQHDPARAVVQRPQAWSTRCRATRCRRSDSDRPGPPGASRSLRYDGISDVIPIRCKTGTPRRHSSRVAPRPCTRTAHTPSSRRRRASAAGRISQHRQVAHLGRHQHVLVRNPPGRRRVTGHVVLVEPGRPRPQARRTRPTRAAGSPTSSSSREDLADPRVPAPPSSQMP